MRFYRKKLYFEKMKLIELFETIEYVIDIIFGGFYYEIDRKNSLLRTVKKRERGSGHQSDYRN